MKKKSTEILGDYTHFYAMQAERLQTLGIDIEGLEVSHLAFRTETLSEYLIVRQYKNRSQMIAAVHEYISLGQNGISF